MSREADALSRIQRLLDAARRIAQPSSDGYRELCAELARTTRLSLPGVELALERCLELSPAQSELDALIASVTPSERAHVILPANVFVAPLRAIALASAAAPRVFVKPSRREPVFVRALANRDPGAFEIVAELAVLSEDQVWAYGSDTTLAALRRDLPRGTVLHAHGDGFGVVMVDLASEAANVEEEAQTAARVALDVACFDQRGCLSPRFVLARGTAQRVLDFAILLARALADVERRIPRGTLDADELADATWYAQAAACFGPVLRAGQGCVTLHHDDRKAAATLDVPPIGRHVEIIRVDGFAPLLGQLAPLLTTVAVSSAELGQQVRAVAPRARIARPGDMQRPPFDGPADRRADPRGVRLD